MPSCSIGFWVATTMKGAGSGLGLEICYNIIHQHHGTIEVQSQPGLTRFIIRLPLTPLSAANQDRVLAAMRLAGAIA